VVFNAGAAGVEFELPAVRPGGAWFRILDTGARAGAAALPCGPTEPIPPRTAVVCEARLR